MSSWIFSNEDLKQTPSATDGFPNGVERRYRYEGSHLIINIGLQKNLHHDTIATGVLFFHRFYMRRSFSKFPRYLTAAACILLAGKVEETPKKCHDIIEVVRTLLTSEQFKVFGSNPKELILTTERILLQTINFDIIVEHPYQYLIKYAQSLKGDSVRINKVVELGWTFVNDRYSSC